MAVSVSKPLGCRPAGTSAVTSVTSVIVNTTILAANPARLGATITNDSNSRLFLKLAATASTTSYTVRLSSQDSYEVPSGYTGIIDGIWAPNVSGFATITEFTP